MRVSAVVAECAKIRAALIFHNIRLYPFNTDESDEEEVQLNESIRVSSDSRSMIGFLHASRR